jgi:hypothetical protein
MALTDDECQQCRVERGKLKALPGELRDMPEVQDRVAKLESTLDSECSSSDDSSYGSSDVAGAVVVGLFGLGVLAAFLAALFGSRQ